ncbi:MAG: hypothetical protein ACFFDN_10665 [Candidatus Hodarchaeota archaeon]
MDNKKFIKNNINLKFPTIICSSVIRATHQGETHGGIYLVDLNSGEYKQVIDWNDPSINWEGRGGDRGLRGIALYDNKIYIAAADRIIVFNKNFEIINSFKNKYLWDCHEIFVFKDSLFITSTAFTSILEFDLKSNTFVKGYYIRQKKYLWFIDSIVYKIDRNIIKKKKFVLTKILRLFKPKLIIFNPNSDNGPTLQFEFHINNVYCDNDRIYFCGSRLNHIYYILNEKIYHYAKVPFETHNARPFKEGSLLIDTTAEKVFYMDLKGNVMESFQIKKFKKNELLYAHFSIEIAKQAFGRGLCITDDELIIVGSSPALITVYKLGCPNALKHVNITMDIRNTIHGLEIWPY